MKKGKAFRPWLTPDNVEIETADLRKIVASWDVNTWMDYLKWYESRLKERLVIPAIYIKSNRPHSPPGSAAIPAEAPADLGHGFTFCSKCSKCQAPNKVTEGVLSD